MSRRNKNNKDTASKCKSSKAEIEEKFGAADDTRRSGGRNNRTRRTPGGKTNHPSWYAQDPALLRDSASIPFSWSVGTEVSMNFPNQPTGGMKYSVPGICAIRCLPSIGLSLDNSSPINIASNAVYSFIRHANSGHANYDAPDLMIYLLSMSQVYAYIVFLQRAYGVATLYSSGNRYTPDHLLKAMNIDPVDLRNNLSDFRYGINLLINKASSFAIPANMPYFDKMSFLYGNVYTEGPSVKDQWYLYTPSRFWKYELASDGSGMLASINFANGHPNWTVQQLLDYGNDMIDRLVYSEDMGIMNGDILKAYGNNILKLTSLPDYFPLVPLFDPLVLEQMKNSTIYNGTTISNLNVTQSSDHSALRFNPIMNINQAATDLGLAASLADQNYESDRLITTSSPVTDPSLVMELTRNASFITPPDPSTEDPEKARKRSIIAESVICDDCVLYNRDMSGHVYFSMAMSDAWDAQHATVGAVQVASLASNFKYHPQMWLSYYVENSKKFTKVLPIWDVDNYAVISKAQLTNLHTAALSSLFNVPYSLTGKLQ